MSNSNETIINNRYRLIAQQGSGGMAVIYEAHDLSLSRIVAIKVLRPSLTTDPSFLSRFRNEARSVANLVHPNIVTLHDIGNEGPTQYMVMEYVDGQDLKKIIKTEGSLPIDRFLKLAIQICSGIGFAHRAGIVHADVKPQNILVTREDVVKVTDFGIAQVISDTQPAERQQLVWGSPNYFAPEQAQGEKPTPASDVYSIGISLFEMLTGRLPYLGQNQQQLALAHIRDPIPMVTEFNPQVPKPLAEIVAKVMSKEPAQRYRMADQLGQILMTFRDRGDQEVAATPVVVASRPPLPIPSASVPIRLTVFVSYAKRDSDRLNDLVTPLTKMHHVWYDRGLQDMAGQNWWDAILREVRERSLFVFALTPDSLLSFACFLEYTYAHRLRKAVLPVKLTPENIPAEQLPRALRVNQYIDLSSLTGVANLVRSLENLYRNGSFTRTDLPDVIQPPVPYHEFNEHAPRILNRRVSLSEGEQRDLVYHLEDLKDEPRTRDGALILLQLLHDRQDISGKVIKRIRNHLDGTDPKLLSLVHES